MIKKMKRSQKDRVIAGFFGGLGEYFDTDPALLRVIGVLVLFWSGFWALVVYIIAILVIPVQQEKEKEEWERIPGSNQQEVKFWRWLLLALLIILLLLPILGLVSFRQYQFEVIPETFHEVFESTRSDIDRRSDQVMVHEQYLPAVEREFLNDHLKEAVLEQRDQGQTFAAHYVLGQTESQIILWAYVVTYQSTDDGLELLQGRSAPVVVSIENDQVLSSLVLEKDDLTIDDLPEDIPDRLQDRLLYFPSQERHIIDHLQKIVEQRAQNFFEVSELE